jgi:hypothetical protein
MRANPIGVCSVLMLCLCCCASDKAGNSKPERTREQTDAATMSSPDAAASCTIDPSCVDIDVPPLTSTACCTHAYSCGYILPDIDSETAMYYPDIKDYVAMLTKDDPNGKCAPESFYFGAQENITETRFEAPGVDDILIASTCLAYHFAAFTFAGCCLPDSSCGLSTHEGWPILEGLAGDPNAPFAHPECVPADELNQQLRDSTLGSLARMKSGGTCNYAELAARLPDLMP